MPRDVDDVRTSVIRTPEDQRVIAEIREEYGLSSDIEAVRFSLRLVNKADIDVDFDIEEQNL